jgi:hypothetical protein
MPERIVTSSADNRWVGSVTFSAGHHIFKQAEVNQLELMRR